ncbi:MAG: glycoside hydrolase family 38 C-terminal domain-containing protein [bacterium]
MKKTITYDAHYISGTHWDREWYRPFQEYRFLLVRLMDELLDLMERDPDFRYFHLDGQTCVLDDYLEIRPENRGRLASLIREGRILIGPWFTMPDLFCVGDEALIRNLLLGRRIAGEWGVEPMPVGFVCDMFGHPSQLPQIFAGFGMRDVLLGRGTNESTTPMFFTWEAPDGSRCFTFKLQDLQGYGALAVPRTVMEVDTFLTSGMKEFGADLMAAGDDADAVTAVREKHCRKEMAAYVRHEMSRANGKTLCLMDAMDHIAPASEVKRYLRLIRAACPEVRPHHSTLPEFFKEARRTARSLPLRRGELREPSQNKAPYLWLIPNCVSARVRMKQANDTCQNLLEKWVEPLVAIANLNGANMPEQHLRVAWRNVLLNHAHDSICGCSIDQVHRDMMYRYDQARVLGEQLRVQALGALTAGCGDLARAKDEFTLTLVNALPTTRDEAVTFDVDLPTDWPTDSADGFNTQRLKTFVLEDAAGNTVPYQRLAFIPKTSERSRFARFCFISDGDFTRYTVAARVELPACGFVSLRVKPSPMPVRSVGTLRTGPTSAENEYLAVAIASNGTLTLTDKVTGQSYTDLLIFEDRSEVGDGWFHGHSLNDEQRLSTASAAQVAVVYDGPEIVSFRVTVTLMVPACYDHALERPVIEQVPLIVSSQISLRRGARVVDVETHIDNTVEDHRLKVLLPTDCAGAKTYLAHHPFDFVEREIRVDAATSTWQEMEQAEKPFLGMQSVAAGRRGLAFLSAGGLHEGGVADDRRRTMQITLLRSFRKTVGTSGESDGLERGLIIHRFALMPFGGVLPRAEAMRELAKIQAGIISRQTGSRPSGYPAMTGKEPATQSFIEVKAGRLVLSSIKPAEQGGGLVIRLWNPTGQRWADTIRLWRKVKDSKYIDLNEKPIKNSGVPRVVGNEITVSAGAHQIVTINVTMN